MHPLVEDLIAHLPAIFDNPPERNPFGRKERSGWFHCSDLNIYKRKTMDYDFAIRQYLGETVEKTWTPESSLHVCIGQGIDALTDAAFQACDEVVQTQCELRNEGLHLRGTPDFIWTDGLDDIVGDVKSTGWATFNNFWANDRWPLEKAYFWRQLQAYLFLSELDEGLLIVVDRGGADRKPLADCFAARAYYRDEAVIAQIVKDVEYMWDKVRERAAST